MDHDCEACSLHEFTDRVCVGGRGTSEADIVLIGEAPGEAEERTGKVFAGRAGQLLDHSLRESGLDPDEVYITNVVKCRPPENRRPDRVEWEACRQYLEAEIRALRPRFVLLLGNSALQVVARTSGITKKRGVVLRVKDPTYKDSTVMATIHPAFVLRSPGQSAVFSEDIRRFARLTRGELRAQPSKARMVRTVEGLRYVRRLLEEAPDGTVVTYDVENLGRPWESEWAIVCLGVTLDGQSAIVVPLFHPSSPFRKRWRDVLRYLKPALERHELKLNAQNGKHDNIQLAGAKVFLEHSFDVMLAAHLVDENRPKNLGFLSQSYLGADEYKGMVETKPDKILQTDLRQLCIYNGHDCNYTHQLREKLKPELVSNPRLLRLFTKLMMPASQVIQQVEWRGMYVDHVRLWSRMIKLQTMITEQVEVMESYLPKEWRDDFNFNSTQQLGRWLFSSEKRGGLGLSPLITTPTGRPSTKESVLLHYHDHPAVRALLRYRTLQLKWMNTYLLPWSTRLDARSRLHTTYKLYGTVTGRLSGDLQQVPRDSFVRGVFGAPPGWKFIQADFSQIELRIAAHCANERRMQRAFLLGEDLHMLTAMDLTGKPAVQVTKEQRKKAKAVNFGFLYEMYPKKFQSYAFESYQLEVTLAEAELAREKYFKMFPDLLPWHARQKRLAHDYHYVSSPIGRVRHLPDILSSDHSVRMEAERQAINSPVQSMASDLMLFSMVKLADELNPREAAMVGTLHDAIFFEVREEMVDEYRPLIKGVMENLPLQKTFGTKLRVPIVAEVEAGQHWGEPEEMI